MNGRFHSRAECLISCSRLFKASHAKAKSRPGHLFSWVCLLFPEQESTAREVHCFPKECWALLHHYQPFVHCTFSRMSCGVAAMLSLDQICTVLIGRSDFDHSVTPVQIFQDLLGLLGFWWVCPEIFHAKGLKMLPILLCKNSLLYNGISSTSSTMNNILWCPERSQRPREWPLAVV